MLNYVLKTALMDSIKYLFHNVLHVLLNAQLAVTLQLTVLHVFMDQSLLLELAVLNVDKMNLVSVVFVLLALNLVTDVLLPLKIVMNVLKDMLNLEQFVKLDV